MLAVPQDGHVSCARTMRQELRPLFDRVVIKELEPDRIRQSGLVVPPGSHEPPPQHGIVLAVGPGIDWWESAGVSMPVRPGDHVVFPASAGVWDRSWAVSRTPSSSPTRQTSSFSSSTSTQTPAS